MYVFSNRETRGLPVPEFSYFVLISCENQLITVECDVYTVPVQNDHRSPFSHLGEPGHRHHDRHAVGWRLPPFYAAPVWSMCECEVCPRSCRLTPYS